MRGYTAERGTDMWTVHPNFEYCQAISECIDELQFHADSENVEKFKQRNYPLAGHVYSIDEDYIREWAVYDVTKDADVVADSFPFLQVLYYPDGVDYDTSDPSLKWLEDSKFDEEFVVDFSAPTQTKEVGTLEDVRYDIDRYSMSGLEGRTAASFGLLAVDTFGAHFCETLPTDTYEGETDSILWYYDHRV